MTSAEPMDVDVNVNVDGREQPTTTSGAPPTKEEQQHEALKLAETKPKEEDSGVEKKGAPTTTAAPDTDGGQERTKEGGANASSNANASSSASKATKDVVEARDSGEKERVKKEKENEAEGEKAGEDEEEEEEEEEDLEPSSPPLTRQQRALMARGGKDKDASTSGAAQTQAPSASSGGHGGSKKKSPSSNNNNNNNNSNNNSNSNSNPQASAGGQAHASGGKKKSEKATTTPKGSGGSHQNLQHLKKEKAKEQKAKEKEKEKEKEKHLSFSSCKTRKKRSLSRKRRPRLDMTGFHAMLRGVKDERERREAIATMKEVSSQHQQHQQNLQDKNGGQLGGFFPSAYGNSLRSSTESYGPYHHSVNLFDPEVLMAGRERSNLKRSSRSSEKKDGGRLQMPYLSSALLLRKDMNAYGYGCPIMLDPEKRLGHRKVHFKIKKSAIIKPEVFSEMLAEREASLQLFKEKGLGPKGQYLMSLSQGFGGISRREIMDRMDQDKGQVLASSSSSKKLEEKDPKAVQRQLEEQEKGEREGLRNVRDQMDEAVEKKAEAIKKRSRIENELRTLHLKRKNLVVQLKHVASTVRQQSLLLMETDNDGGRSRGQKGPAFQVLGSPRSPRIGGVGEVEEGEVKNWKRKREQLRESRERQHREDERLHREREWGAPPGMGSKHDRHRSF